MAFSSFSRCDILRGPPCLPAQHARAAYGKGDKPRNRRGFAFFVSFKE